MADALGLDLYNCDICMENMLDKNPRMLSCHHSFCMDCLSKMVKQGSIECPTCRNKSAVPNDDVNQLQPNFMLIKVKEHVDKVFSNKVVLCQICKTADAVLKCQECCRLLCDSCSNKHNKVKAFEAHNLYKLCPQHSDDMTAHICLKCLQPVCATCIITQHTNHETEISAYQEGITKLLTRIEQAKSQLDEKMKMSKCFLQAEEMKIKSTDRAEEILIETVEYHAQKLKEAKQCIKQLNDFRKKENTAIIESKKLEEEVEEIKTLLIKVSLEVQDGLCDGLQSATERVDNILDKVPGVPLVPDVTLTDQKSGYILTLAELIRQSLIPKNVTYLRYPGLVKTEACLDKQGWSEPWCISVLDRSSVIITDIGRNTVTIAYQSEKESKKITLPHGDIKDTCVFCGNFYFAFSNIIIKRPMHALDPNQDIFLIPNTEKIRRCLTVSETCIILLCNNQVVVFDPTTSNSRVAVDKLSDPKRVALGYINGKETFAVACRGSSEVHLYDRNWHKLNMCGGSNGKLGYYPYDVSFTPNRIIVSDADNHRLCLYDFDGKFVQNMFQSKLTGYADGIMFNYPYLWVAETKKGDQHPDTTIKLFRICHRE